jgi:hypothetical protein
MLQFLPYALAAYGGYKGYKGSKDAGGSGLQRILGGLTGAAAGYYGGKGVIGGGSALGVPGFSAAQSSFTPFTQLGPIQSLASTQAGQLIGLPQFQSVTTDAMPVQSVLNPAAQKAVGAATAADTVANTAGGLGGTPAEQNFLQKLFTQQRIKNGAYTGELQIDPMKAALAIGAGTYLSGAFDPQPQDVFTPTYNLAVADLQRERGGFKYIDPETGVEKTFEQPYIPEADPKNQGDYRIGNMAIERNRFNQGGLASIAKFNEGGINYLPSKRTHDEDDSVNYVRASGYVEDGSGTGDKDEDTMLAQLADGEFVTRADGVLGAGIIAGGNPSSMKDMREKGAKYFYDQQARYKRVFDLLQKGKDAQTKVS